MYSIKKSLNGLIGLFILVAVLAAIMPLIGRGQGQGQPPFEQRKFYVTQTTHNGSQALTACANGYHMASLWEILDPSNLRYNTQLGLTQDDSGFGPPSSTVGWVHTGRDASIFDAPGSANCNAWESDSGDDRGTTVNLSSQWADNASVIAPWRPFVFPCNTLQPVWCVQD